MLIEAVVRGQLMLQTLEATGNHCLLPFLMLSAASVLQSLVFIRAVCAVPGTARTVHEGLQSTDVVGSAPSPAGSPVQYQKKGSQCPSWVSKKSVCRLPSMSHPGLEAP